MIGKGPPILQNDAFPLGIDRCGSAKDEIDVEPRVPGQIPGKYLGFWYFVDQHVGQPRAGIGRIGFGANDRDFAAGIVVANSFGRGRPGSSVANDEIAVWWYEIHGAITGVETTMIP